MKIWTSAILATACASMAATTVPGRAQNYPNGPVALVIGNPAGGAGDIVAGAISERLAKALGQPVNIEYRPGASGGLGAGSVTRAPPNGRTLLLGQTTEIVINRALAREIGYDPESDLLPVALLAIMPLALIVPSNAPYSTVEELVKASRSSPRGLSFASTGAGTPGHLAGELLRIRTNGRFTHVPLMVVRKRSMPFSAIVWTSIFRRCRPQCRMCARTSLKSWPSPLHGVLRPCPMSRPWKKVESRISTLLSGPVSLHHAARQMKS